MLAVCLADWLDDSGMLTSDTDWPLRSQEEYSRAAVTVGCADGSKTIRPGKLF